MNPRHRAHDLAAERQPVHKRHFDVGDQDIRLDVLQHRQRDFAVRRFPGQKESALLPREIVPDALPDDDLVIHHKSLIHLHPSD